MTDQVNCKPDDFQEEDPTAPKFTPGSWKIGFFKEQGIITALGVFEDNAMDGERVNAICLVSKKEDAQSIDVHNAGLIAAAPEMYEMLSEIFKWIYEHDEWWMNIPGKGGFDSDRIEKLLAKARGQNPENK